MRMWPGQFMGLRRYSASSSSMGGYMFSRVVLFVAGDLPELAAHDVRGEDHLVAAADALIAHPVFHGLADEAALGMPEDEAGAGDFLDAEEVELLAEDAVVAGLDFFEVLEVGVEIFGVEEGGAVDALELLVVLVAEPVGAGDGRDLEGLDAAGGGHVRAAAEVGEVAVLVERDFVAGFGEALDEVDLHELALRGVVGEGLARGARRRGRRVRRARRLRPCGLRWRRGRLR